MAIGTTGRRNPITGEEITTQFEYTPVSPEEQRRRLEDQQSEAMQRMLMQQIRQARTAEAMRAVAAAIQYQGRRRFDNDVASGMSRADAMAKHARDMFYSDPDAYLKAIQPEPAMTPYQREMINLSKQRLNAPDLRSVGNGGLVQVNPDGTMKELYAPSKSLSPEERMQQELQGREFSAAMKAFQDARKVLLDPETTPAQAEMAQSELNRAEKTIKRIRSPKSASASMAQPGPAPLSSVVEQAAPIAPAPTAMPSKKRYRWDNGKLVEIK